MREAERGIAHGSNLFLHASGPVAPAAMIGATAGVGQVPPRRIGIVGNPRSHAYRSLAGDARRFCPQVLEIAEPSTPDALRATLARFAANRVDLLVVQGGDGTVRDVLTALPTAFGDAPPELAILATGNTNLAARVFGRVAPGPRGLARLADAARKGSLRRSHCRTLRVDWPGDPNRGPVRGLFLGACLYADGKRLADARIHGNGVHNGAAVALAVLSALAGALSRRDGALRRGTWRRISPAGEAGIAGDGFVFLATSLDRLMLGFWPFGSRDGDRGGNGGAIRWLDVVAPPRRLPTILLRILLRRDGAGANGHRTGRSDRIGLELHGSFVLDGEFFEPGPDGVVLSDGGTVTIVCA